MILIACSLRNCGWFNVPPNDGQNCGNLSNHIKPSLYRWFQNGNYLRVTSTKWKTSHRSSPKLQQNQSTSIHNPPIKSAYLLKPEEHDLFWKPSFTAASAAQHSAPAALVRHWSSAFRAVCHSGAIRRIRDARCLHFPVKKRNYLLHDWKFELENSMTLAHKKTQLGFLTNMTNQQYDLKLPLEMSWEGFFFTTRGSELNRNPKRSVDFRKVSENQGSAPQFIAILMGKLMKYEIWQE